MGNFLERSPQSPPNRSLITQLTDRTVAEISECMVVLNEDYADSQCINYAQFEDVFCPIVEDAEPFFLALQNQHDIDGEVDIYEALAAFAIFCGDRFENKVTFVFKLFDFDHSSSLEMSEMILTFQSAARGICKFVNIEPPSLKDIEELTEYLFETIDLDYNKIITQNELLFWARNHNELQEFILKHTGTKTHENLKKRADRAYSVLNHIFGMARDLNNGSDYAKKEDLAKLMKSLASEYFTDSDISFLTTLIVNNTQALNSDIFSKSDPFITEDVYDEVIKAWSAFYSIDIHNEGHVSIKEFPLLIWVYEGREPTAVRAKNKLEEAGGGRDGFVDKIDWIKNLCTIEDDENAKFRVHLKALFNKYDTDNSGCLSQVELQKLVAEAFKDYIKKASGDNTVKAVNDMLDSLTKEIFRELDSNPDGDIQWEEFKDYMKIAPARYKKLKEFLDANL